MTLLTRRLLLVSFLIISGLSLSGCGQKGPLVPPTPTAQLSAKPAATEQSAAHADLEAAA